VIRFVIAVALFYGVSAMAQEKEQPAPSPSATATTATDDNAAGTSEYNVKMDIKESRILFGLYGQMSSFARAGTSFMGYNLEGVTDYAMSDRWAVQISLAQSFDLANGFTILYTGLRLGGAYTIWGQFMKRTSVVSVDGQDTLSVQTSDEPMLVADVGVDQYLFNGTDRIVPATGISLGARYDRNIWGHRGSLMFRYGQLVIAEDPVALMTAGAGFLLRF